MAIDHRRLLKDTIRGAMLDHDLPSPPAPLDPENDETPTQEELEYWFELAREVLDEEAVLPPGALREFERLKREFLGD